MAVTLDIDHARTRAKAAAAAGQPVVPLDGSETIRVTLTARRSGDADVTFTARGASGTTVLSVKDRFVKR